MAVGVLTTVLAGLLWVLGGALALLLAFMLLGMLVPVALSASGRELSWVEPGDNGTVIRWPDGDWRWEVRWLFGLVRWTGSKTKGSPAESRLHVAGLSLPVRLEAMKRLQTGLRKGSRAQRFLNQWAARARARRPSFAELRALWPDLKESLPGMMRSAGMHADGTLVYGFDDPSLTGWCEAVRAVVPLPGTLTLVPDFTGPRLGGNLAVQMSFWPIRAALAGGRFLMRPRVRRWLWRQIRQGLAQVPRREAAARP